MPERRRAPATVPLTASARIMGPSLQTSRDTLWQYASWQKEAWAFYDNLGEFEYGVSWLANALSRVRLTAAELVPGGDEPDPVDEGPAADLVDQLGGGTTGHAAIMKAFGVHLSVPGEAWLVAQRPSTDVALADADWSVKSTDEIRPNRNGGYEIQVDENVWEPLPAESLPVRVWEPHPRWSWRANSAARAAIPIMRRIDLLDRRIIAMLVSRLAMNGIILIPQEGTFTVPEEYQDKPDPFVAMLLDIAARNIAEPGSASAAIPIPIRFTTDLIKEWRHLTFGDPIDEQLLNERDKEIRRLATALNMPAEVLLGLGDTSHWNAWQISEEGIKLHISPLAETIVAALTVGYLQPLLKSAGVEPTGPNGGRLVVWYDTSELSARPDKSQQALAAYDRIEISGAALRRESGLGEADAPDKDEVREQVLKKLVVMPATALQALAALLGEQQLAQTPVPGDRPEPERGGVGPAPPPGSSPGTGQQPSAVEKRPPDTRGQPPPPPGSDTAAVAQAAARLLGIDLHPMRVPVAAGLRGPPGGNSRHSSNGHSRDGPRRRG